MEYVTVLVSTLGTFPHDRNSNWRSFSVGESASASSRKLIPVDHESPYSASRLEEGLSSFKVWGERYILYSLHSFVVTVEVSTELLDS